MSTFASLAARTGRCEPLAGHLSSRCADGVHPTLPQSDDAKEAQVRSVHLGFRSPVEADGELLQLLRHSSITNLTGVTSAVQLRLNGDRLRELNNFRHQLAELDRYHGQPNGMFSCDEQLAGLEQTHGTELCTVLKPFTP